VEPVVTLIGARALNTTLNSLLIERSAGYGYSGCSIHIYWFPHTEKYIFAILARRSWADTIGKAVPPPFPSLVGCSFVDGGPLVVYDFVFVMIFETGTITKFIWKLA